MAATFDASLAASTAGCILPRLFPRKILLAIATKGMQSTRFMMPSGRVSDGPTPSFLEK
jgi:hypothetical protein